MTTCCGLSLSRIRLMWSRTPPRGCWPIVRRAREATPSTSPRTLEATPRTLTCQRAGRNCPAPLGLRVRLVPLGLRGSWGFRVLSVRLEQPALLARPDQPALPASWVFRGHKGRPDRLGLKACRAFPVFRGSWDCRVLRERLAPSVRLARKVCLACLAFRASWDCRGHRDPAVFLAFLVFQASLA